MVDLVFSKLQPYRQKSLARRPNEKLSPRFYGPFQVLLDRLLINWSCLCLVKLHPVFHVSMLEKAKGPNLRSEPPEVEME